MAAQVTRSPTPAGLNERYVGEWLGALVTANVADYGPAPGLQPFARVAVFHAPISAPSTPS